MFISLFADDPVKKTNAHIVNDIDFRTLMSEVCCYADERFYLKVQILISFTVKAQTDIYK